MHQVYKYFCTTFLLVLVFVSAKGQNEIGTYFLDGTWAARELNVTDTLKGNFELYLPGVFLESHHSNSISLSDIIQDNGETSTLNLNGVIDQLDPTNSFENNLKINTIGIGFKLKSFQIDFRHNARINSIISYPRELAQLVFQGNAQFIGETVNFGPAVDYFAYHEYSLGVAKQFGALTLGGRIKYLNGIGFLRTLQNDASLFTDDDVFQLTFDTDYVLNTSNSVDIEGVSDFNFRANVLEQFVSANNGVAFDFGVAFNVNDKISLKASVLDLGSINWTEDTRSFQSRGEFTYEGVDLDDFLLNDSVEFEVKLDTIEDVFAFEESLTEDKTSLNAKIYLAGQYQINNKLTVGALFHLDNLDSTDPAIGLNAQYRFSRTFLLGINYSYRKDNFSNLGVQFIAELGPVVLFGNTDNLISVLLNDNYGSNGRLGLGLVF